MIGSVTSQTSPLFYLRPHKGTNSPANSRPSNSMPMLRFAGPAPVASSEMHRATASIAEHRLRNDNRPSGGNPPTRRRKNQEIQAAKGPRLLTPFPCTPFKGLSPWCLQAGALALESIWPTRKQARICAKSHVVQ